MPRVDLENENKSIWHSSPAPWAYAHHYTMDIVGEESLVVLFLYKECLNNLENCKLFFPIRPSDDNTWNNSLKTRPFNYNEIKDIELKIRVSSRNANGAEYNPKLEKFINECIKYYKKRSNK